MQKSAELRLSTSKADIDSFLNGIIEGAATKIISKIAENLYKDDMHVLTRKRDGSGAFIHNMDDPVDDDMQPLCKQNI